MSKIVIYLTIILLTIKSLKSQDIQLETFDKKESIISWNIISDIGVKHTNNYNFRDINYFKKTLDSFIVFSDSNAFSFAISRKFKMIPSRSIELNHSILSEDSLNDYLDYGFRILDKNGKKLFSFFYHSQHFIIPNVAVSHAGIQLPDPTDSIWKKADSIEVVYSFSPHDFDSIRERVIVLDGITLSGKYASLSNYRSNNFEIYPNPAYRTIYFKFNSFKMPDQIYFYDYTGRLVMQSEPKDEINIDNFKPGLYFVTIQFENSSSTQKLQIY